MYKKILLAYDCEEEFETVLQELNKLTDNSTLRKNDETSLITILLIIPQQKLENSITYGDKHFDELVKEEKIKFKPFFDELDLNHFNYETKFVYGNVKTEILEEIQTHKYEIAILSNRDLKFQWKDALGDIAHKISKQTDTPILLIN